MSCKRFGDTISLPLPDATSGGHGTGLAVLFADDASRREMYRDATCVTFVEARRGKSNWDQIDPP